jgi:formylmethanofuran dehydrogenase subunit E
MDLSVEESIVPFCYWCRDHRGRGYGFEELIRRVESFHSYPAPGVLIGVKMVDIALRGMPAGVLFDAVCETLKCLPDAVQLLTPCTVGNGWLRIAPIGRYAVSLYDKRSGEGRRVYLDPARLNPFPEIHHWFFGTKPKRKNKTELLVREIREAEDVLYGIQTVLMKRSWLSKPSSGPRALCPKCGETYPAGHGPACRGCLGDGAYYERKC